MLLIRALQVSLTNPETGTGTGYGAGDELYGCGLDGDVGEGLTAGCRVW